MFRIFSSNTRKWWAEGVSILQSCRRKFKSLNSKCYVTENYTESRNLQELKQKKFRLELTNYQIPDSR